MPKNEVQPEASVLLKPGSRRLWLRLRDPVDVLQTHDLHHVKPLLHEIETRVERDGLYAAGMVGYEAAPAFDSALTVRPPGSMPLAWFGLYRAPERLDELPVPDEACRIGDWRAMMSREAYGQAFSTIREAIAAGATYQVNLTYRLRTTFEGSAYAFFYRLASAQQGGCEAFLDLGRWQICSASPELFFRREGDVVLSRPMKGTAARGLTFEDDRARAKALAASVKDRAENVMIVDMIRNDLGRVADTGSVRVPRLFAIEQYPTVWQMTSTVCGRSGASLDELFAALFPCASVTGAPKVNTMGLIAELERTPRGVYCGAVGYVAPGRRARFNVAIRTAVVDGDEHKVEYGIGGGIVWDSGEQAEYRETLAKRRILDEELRPFDLLETLLWEPGRGYFLLDLHLDRLCRSAQYFDYRVDLSTVRRSLLEQAAGLATPHKVRLRVGRDGKVMVEGAPLEMKGTKKPAILALSDGPVDRAERWLYHKTTRREVYEAARRSCPDADEVLLWNEAGEVTEGTISNILARIDGQWVTPPVSCGLLPGVLRQRLLERGRVQERVLRVSDLAVAERILLINSVRKCRPAVLSLDLAKLPGTLSPSP
jgi:para-aminobenzoate synthetase/4-amino-4-deoxychorismate lyase